LKILNLTWPLGGGILAGDFSGVFSPVSIVFEVTEAQQTLFRSRVRNRGGIFNADSVSDKRRDGKRKFQGQLERTTGKRINLGWGAKSLGVAGHI
jgi:hypothetical protein